MPSLLNALFWLLGATIVFFGCFVAIHELGRLLLSVADRSVWILAFELIISALATLAIIAAVGMILGRRL